MATSTTATSAVPQAPPAPPTLRLRHVKRASNNGPKLSPLQLCKPLPATVDALDLSRVSPTQTLASLRFLVLSHLSDLERHLSELESPDLEAWKAKGEIKIEEAMTWAKTALDMLNGIRADVRSQLPDVHFSDLASVEIDVRSHLPELPHLLDMAEVRSHFPEISYLPDMPDMRTHLPDFSDMCVKLEDVRNRFQEIDSRKLLGYVPTLSMHLQNLHSHLSSTEAGFSKMLGLPSLAPSSLLHEVLDALSSSEVMQEIAALRTEAEEQSQALIKETACEVARAVEHSLEGMRLIKYHHLPEPWKNNPYVTQGYRFIPIERWPLLIKSVFTLHNETLNIHTHLIPLILFLVNIISIIRNPTHIDAPEVLFMSFACVCLLGSTVWHTMSGCAHHNSMEFCARVDYVGIGWLISASVATTVYYGYQCHPKVGHAFEVLCFMMGLLGNVLPFMTWFNQNEYRFYRIGFFLTLAFSGLAPLFGMSILHSPQEMSEFITPLFPSFSSYLIGLAFYAFHWPERHLPGNVRASLDSFGGSSHAIWHCFIVLAVLQHKQGMQSMKDGFQCLVEYTSS
ncbi:hypothetical protein AN958_03518 [Leucoagaricus sp. SymC.cos]|nr:hypothetical protein AN958_03518 [Leucoagaricus sp. SymC.cos]